MTEADRDQLIDAYFEALDAEDPEIVRPAVADDVVYESLVGDLEGFAGLETYIEELREVSDSTHDVTLRVHDETASVVAGRVRGMAADGPMEAAFCDVFRFDTDDDRITQISVYLNDA